MSDWYDTIVNNLANAINNQDVEYIEGTHGTTATATWTGTCTKIRKLKAGTKIYFKLTSAGASNVTLNLTLADGTTTGAKNVFFNNTTRLSTQYGQNAIISLVYDGTQWRVLDPYTNTNYYDRMNNFIQCTAGEALATQIIAGAKSDGKYYKIASGLVLDIRHPIVWLGGAIAKDANSNNVYGAYSGVNIQTTLANKTVTALKKVYIKGTLNKSSFTVHSDVFVSDDNLTDGFYYIPIGVSTSTTSLRFNTINQEVYVYTTANGLMPVGFNPLFTLIPASSSNAITLNDYKTGGFYYCDNDENIAVYIDNCPLPKASNKSFFLLVETWGASNTKYVKQTLTYYNYNQTYVRTCNNGTWQDWKELTHPSYTARTGVPTADYTLNFGSRFNISQPVSDATGHITALNQRWYTLPPLGTTSGTACAGNDSRLSDARTPLAHEHTNEIERHTLESNVFLDLNYETGMAVFTWWGKSWIATNANVWETVWTLPTIGGYRIVSAQGAVWATGNISSNPNSNGIKLRVTNNGTVDAMCSVANQTLNFYPGQISFLFDYKAI